MEEMKVLKENQEKKTEKKVKDNGKKDNETQLVSFAVLIEKEKL